MARAFALSAAEPTTLSTVRVGTGASPALVLLVALCDVGLAAFAAWVVLCQAALLLGWTFHSLSLIYSGALALVVPLAFTSRFPELRYAANRLVGPERWSLASLAALAVGGAVLALLAIRPDGDDVNYVSRVVYHLEHPGEPLDLEFHDFWILEKEMSSALKIFQTWSFLCGYVAYVTGMPFLDVYHLALPALGGALIPLAWVLTFSKFARSVPTALVAALAVCVFLALNGEPHRSFGNFAFVRIWHGKAILMSILAPLFLHASFEFFERGTVRAWLRLALTGIAGAGVSSTALFFLPALGALLAASVWQRQRVPFSQHAMTSVAYLASQVYLVLLGAYTVIATHRPYLSVIGRSGFPERFNEQFELVFTGWTSPHFIAVIGLAIVAIVAVRRDDRALLITWIVVAVLLFLNPIVFPLLTSVTTLNTYWRLFYLLPIPLVAGLCCLLLEHIPPRRARFAHAATAVSLVLIAVMGNVAFPRQATFAELPFAFPQWKFDTSTLADARAIVAASPPGPMLAPTRYSIVVPILTSRFPQVVVREMNLMSHAVAHDEVAQARLRLAAQELVTVGDGGPGLAGLEYLVAHGLRTVVATARATRAPGWREAETLLRNAGFQPVQNGGRYRLYARGVKPADAQEAAS